MKIFFYFGYFFIISSKLQPATARNFANKKVFYFCFLCTSTYNSFSVLCQLIFMREKAENSLTQKKICIYTYILAYRCVCMCNI